MVKEREKKSGLKTFNLDNEVYKEFSEHCKMSGISMSKKIENFIREEIEQMKGGGKVMVKRFVKNVGIDRGKEHSFKKYC